MHVSLPWLQIAGLFCITADFFTASSDAGATGARTGSSNPWNFLNNLPRLWLHHSSVKNARNSEELMGKAGPICSLPSPWTALRRD